MAAPKRVAIVSDLHVPYHDVDAYRLVLKVFRALQPDILVINGDLADCYAVSAHQKTWGRRSDWQWEIDEVQKSRKELEECADRLIIAEGNHEDRWPRYLASKCPEDNRRSNEVREVFGFSKRWQYVKYRDYARIGSLYVTHDVERCGKHALPQSLADTQHNVAIGHIHRLGVVYESDAVGNAHVAISTGWLGDVNAIDYKHKIRARRDWQLGFGWGLLEPNGTVHLQAVPIVDGKCVVEGQVYSIR